MISLKKDYRIIEGKSVSFMIKGGTGLHCRSGMVWLTADGRDMILKEGESITWRGLRRRAAMVSLNGNAKMTVWRRRLFFEKLPLPDLQAGLAGTLSG